MGLFWFLLPLSTFTGRGSGDQVSMVWNGTFPINNVWEWAIRATVGFGFAPDTTERGFVWFESHDSVYHEGCSSSEPYYFHHSTRRCDHMIELSSDNKTDTNLWSVYGDNHRFKREIRFRSAAAVAMQTVIGLVLMLVTGRITIYEFTIM